MKNIVKGKIMEELFNLGISEKTMDNMLDINPYLKQISKNEILHKIQLLKSINCSDREIFNVISSNPIYLNQTNDKLVTLFNYLLSLGFSTLDVLFDANPYILNLDIFEIEKYINTRLNSGELLEDIIDDLDSNPFLFNEI